MKGLCGRMRFYWWRITLPLSWNQQFYLFPKRLQEFTFLLFLHFLHFFDKYILTHLEPVELEFVFAGRFCPAGTEDGGAFLVVRPIETKSENLIVHVLGMS